MLLSDPDVIRFVNENFVACWQMVRPVPQVTIDFGDGRRLRRTLGGNAGGGAISINGIGSSNGLGGSGRMTSACAKAGAGTRTVAIRRECGRLWIMAPY